MVTTVAGGLVTGGGVGAGTVRGVVAGVGCAGVGAGLACAGAGVGADGWVAGPGGMGADPPPVLAPDGRLGPESGGDDEGHDGDCPVGVAPAGSFEPAPFAASADVGVAAEPFGSDGTEIGRPH